MKTVVYCATRNIYQNIVYCVTSLAENGNIDEVVLLIEDDIFPYELPIDYRVINVADQPWFDRNHPNAKKRWTYMTMLKVVMTKLLSDLDRVLILDCDTMVEQDISALWSLDLAGYYYAAVKQPNDGREWAFSHGADYFNCGVLLCNLDALRDGKEDELIKALQTREWDFLEQDAINELCRGRILELPGRYNVSYYTVPDTELYIRHYAAEGGWWEYPEVRRYNVKL